MRAVSIEHCTVSSSYACDLAKMWRNTSVFSPCFAGLSERRGSALLLLQFCCSEASRQNVVQDALDAALVAKEGRRRSDYVGQMLWLQQLRATEYFSRWIELKEHHASKTSSA